MKNTQCYEKKYQDEGYQRSKEEKNAITLNSVENRQIEKETVCMQKLLSKADWIMELNRWHAFDKGILVENEQIQGTIQTCLQQAADFIKSHSVAFKRNYAGGCHCHYCYPMEAIYQCLYICFMKTDFLKSKEIVVDIFQNRIEFSFPKFCENGVNTIIEKILKQWKLIEGVENSFELIDQCYQKEERKWQRKEDDTRMTIILENTYYRPVERKMVEKLRVPTRKCYEMIHDCPGIQLKELAEKLNRPYITIQTEVRNLRKKQLVERRGKVITGGYYCIDIEHE